MSLTPDRKENDTVLHHNITIPFSIYLYYSTFTIIRTACCVECTKQKGKYLCGHDKRTVNNHEKESQKRKNTNWY